MASRHGQVGIVFMDSPKDASGGNMLKVHGQEGISRRLACVLASAAAVAIVLLAALAALTDPGPAQRPFLRLTSPGNRDHEVVAPRQLAELVTSSPSGAKGDESGSDVKPPHPFSAFVIGNVAHAAQSAEVQEGQESPSEEASLGDLRETTEGDELGHELVERGGDEPEGLGGVMGGSDGEVGVPMPSKRTNYSTSDVRTPTGSVYEALLGVAASSPGTIYARHRQDVELERHIFPIHADLGGAISDIEGTVVVRRPELVQDLANIYPVHSLDFAKVFEGYSAIFKRSLIPGSFLKEEALKHVVTYSVARFLTSVRRGEDFAPKYLSIYDDIAAAKAPHEASVGYEAPLSVASMAEVFIKAEGFVFNRKDYIVPRSCKSDLLARKPAIAPTRPRHFPEVFVMTQHWGDGYFHFMCECLPRIVLMLDVLRDHPEIKIAVHAQKIKGRRKYMSELVEILGISRNRLVFIDAIPIQAGVAFIPESTPCGQPNTALVSLLRSALLKGLYPGSQGVPPLPARPIIVLIVRTSKRYLRNNMMVERALERNFPDHDVVPFLGAGSMRGQLELFSKARMIVGPHGAGFSNMVVAPLHTPVLEIGPISCSFCYLHLALKLQHIYGRHDGGQWDRQCEAVYEADVEELMVVARALLEATRAVEAVT